MIYQQKVDYQAHYLPKVYYDFLEEEGLYCPTASPHRSGMRRGSRRR